MSTDSPPTLRAWLAAEPFTLAMSSGFFGFFAHTGFLCAIEEAGLAPAAVAGSSAGALVAGLWAAGLPAADIATELRTVRRQDFWDPAPGAGLLRGRLFRERLRSLLPVEVFEQCRVPLVVSAWDVGTRRTVVLADGPLAPAIQASCSFPGLLQPVRIDGRAYLDGGIADRPGLAGVPDGSRLLFHHLPSKSPWRRRGSPALRIPGRQNMVALATAGLTRVGPFKLHRGAQAYQQAREATRRALDLVVDGGVVEVEAAAADEPGAALAT